MISRYDFAEYRGTIFPAGGGQVYTLNSMGCKAEGNLEVTRKGGLTSYARKRNGKSYKEVAFNRDLTLHNHLIGRHNFAIFFRQKMETVVDGRQVTIFGNKMIAFDLDSSTKTYDEPLYDSAWCLWEVLNSLGLTPFWYSSGGKGYHFEVFFDGVIPIKKLNALNAIILTKHKDMGGHHIDCVYPSNMAYRIFGCFHYRTGDFTKAVKVEADKDGRYRGKLLDYGESWELFAKTPCNDAGLVDKIIAANPEICAPPEKDKRAIQHKLNYTPKAVYYSKDTVKRLYETGLHGEYHRYKTAFQLGRYFKHVLNLDERQVKKEADRWLRRHYVEHCHDATGLTPFEGAHTNAIEASYEACKEKTIENCCNGYQRGKPFGREYVRIYEQEASEYIKGLSYNKKQKAGLSNLLGYAVKFSSLDMNFSYSQLLEIFGVGGRDTVSSWLKLFLEDNVLSLLELGTYGKRKSSRYRLMLPKNCYEVIAKPKCRDTDDDTPDEADE